MLEELDSTLLGTRKPGNRVMEFHQRDLVKLAEVLRPDMEDMPMHWNRTQPEPEGPMNKKDQPQDATFSRRLQSAKLRYGQDTAPAARPTVQVEVRQRADFN
jgi:hypothetical protein